MKRVVSVAFVIRVVESHTEILLLTHLLFCLHTVIQYFLFDLVNEME